MRVPGHLERFIGPIQAKLASIGHLTFDDVMMWVGQFKEEDQALAVSLFLNLYYIDHNELKRLCGMLFAQLPESVSSNLGEVFFVGLGGPSDSGNVLAYHYRIINNVPENSFLWMDNLRKLLDEGAPAVRGRKHLVFIDDFIGTGGQGTELLSKELKDVLSAGRFEYVGFHTLAGFSDGVERIESITSIDVKVAHRLTEKDKVFHEASNILTEDYFDRKRMKAAIEEYGKRLYPQGPLGYGDTQALVAFYYNTPNNTLPVIWATGSWGWKALLPRTELRQTHEASEDEKLILTYIASVGGQCSVTEILELANVSASDLETAVRILTARHVVKILDDDTTQHIKLTAKGHREFESLLMLEQSVSHSRFGYCVRHFMNYLPENPRSSHQAFRQVQGVRNQLLSILELACSIQDVSTVVRLRALTSWLLLADHDWEERIRLGKSILAAFSQEQLGLEWGMVMIDDLGWTYVAQNQLETAEEHINQGLEDLWKRQHLYGICQGWRHLQAIKSRRGNFVEAEMGMRIVFGASCAIPEAQARLEMQAGIARGLATISYKNDRASAFEIYTRLADELSKESGEHVHATPSKPPLRQKQSRPDYSGDVALLLVRHPLAIKNQKNVFGRYSVSTLPADGKRQLDTVPSEMKAVAIPNEKTVRVFSALAKGNLLLANRIAEKYGWPVNIDSALDSIDSGDLTGLSEEDAAEHYPELIKNLTAYRQHRLDGYELEFPGGETVRDLTMRVARFLLDTVYGAGTPPLTVVVGHNSTITAMLNIFSAIEHAPRAEYRYFDVPIASITRISVNPGEIRVGVTRVTTHDAPPGQVSHE